jgi:small subunit ribosomal protein S20
MPTTKSAKKRLRQSQERRDKNRSIKRAIRSKCRKVTEAVKTGDAGKAEEEYREAVKQLDRAGTRKIVHPNSVARTKSRLSAKIKKIKKK